MTESQKEQLGLEIVSGMKASAYGLSIEEGRELALSETEPNYFHGYKGGLEPTCNAFELAAKRAKNRLEKQSLFIANIALDMIEKIRKDDEGK